MDNLAKCVLVLGRPPRFPKSLRYKYLVLSNEKIGINADDKTVITRVDLQSPVMDVNIKKDTR